MDYALFKRISKVTLGKEKADRIAIAIALVIGCALPIALFILLPTLLAGTLDSVIGSGIWRNLLEGALRLLIFFLFLFSVSRMKDIKRTFSYHGAEHKSIHCYEHGLPLTVENVQRFPKEHPRCGTSFMFVMMLIGILIGFFIPFDNAFLRTACKILLLPLTVGIGFEFLMYAGKHDNPLVRILSAPGLWMQRITTREPDASQIEVAIASLKAAMPDEFPVEERTEQGTAPEASPAVEPEDGNSKPGGAKPAASAESSAT